MKWFVSILLILFAMSAFAPDANAWTLFRSRTRTTTVTRQVFSGGPQSVCEQKAQIMASRRVHGHIGGGYGGGNAEGTGFSPKSATVALGNCCFVGVRTCIGAAVVRGSDGWYAVRIYR